MPITSGPIKSQQLAFRTTREDRVLIEKAARIQGLSPTDYMRQTVIKRAKRDVR